MLGGREALWTVTFLRRAFGSIAIAFWTARRAIVDARYASAWPSICRGCLPDVPQHKISSSRFCMGLKL